MDDILDFETSLKHKCFTSTGKRTDSNWGKECMQGAPWMNMNYNSCEDCGKQKFKVEWERCPYWDDVHNLKLYAWFCEDCLNVRADDI